MYERDFQPDVYKQAAEPVVAGEYYLRGLMLFDGEITGEWLDTYRMEEAKPERYKGHFYISEAGILFDLTTR